MHNLSGVFVQEEPKKEKSEIESAIEIDSGSENEGDDNDKDKDKDNSNNEEINNSEDVTEGYLYKIQGNKMKKIKLKIYLKIIIINNSKI